MQRSVVSVIALVDRPIGPDGQRSYPRDGEHFRREEHKRLELWSFDPYGNDPVRIPLHVPHGAVADDVVHGVFIDATPANLTGDGRRSLAVAITPRHGDCYLYTCDPDGKDARLLRVLDRPEVDFIRSVCAGDLNGDGVDELVLGSRPNGHVLILDSKGGIEEVESRRFGEGVSNTREVTVADLDGDGRPEILAAIAEAGPGYAWRAHSGVLVCFRREDAGWASVVLDDFDGATHSRMVVVGACGRGGARAFSVNVAVHDPRTDTRTCPATLVAYTLDQGHVRRETIDVFEEAIKSRSLAIGNPDGLGPAILVGTRNLDERGSTYLLSLRWDDEKRRWERSVIDTSGELGFHCVAVIPARQGLPPLILASDDGRGQIKAYRWTGSAWEARILFDYPHAIFTVSFHEIDE